MVPALFCRSYEVGLWICGLHCKGAAIKSGGVGAGRDADRWHYITYQQLRNYRLCCLGLKLPGLSKATYFLWFTMVMTTVVHCLRMRIIDLGGLQSCSGGRSTSLRDLSNINKGPCLCDVQLIFGKPIWNRIMRGCIECAPDKEQV